VPPPSNKPLFSLVVATLGRTEELGQLFASILDQSVTDIEVIVVDQNPDDRLRPHIENLSRSVACKHIHETGYGVSWARNRGLEAAAGEFVAFPDDDCSYSPRLLSQVADWLRTHPSYGLLAVGSVDDTGTPSGNRWVQSSCDIRPHNVFRTTFCSSLFFSRSAIPTEVRFDQRIGPGSHTPFGCGEETDFVLGLLNQGMRGRFERSMKVVHPRRDMLTSEVSQDRAIGYGRGMGRVLRKHSLHALWAGLVTYDLARYGLVRTQGKRSAAQLCLAHAKGLVSGFTARHSEAVIAEVF
jgi:glycosyltransferase involved in cell wall biosynthesis